MKRKHGFTLIEILVVVAIISLLVAILLPALKKARAQTRRAVCATHLHQVGLAMNAYMQDSRDRMPFVSYMPSFDKSPLDLLDKPGQPPVFKGPVFFADVLKRHLKGDLKVLECPDDRPGAVEDRDPRAAPNTGLSYYQSERSSYDYRWRLAGLTPDEFSGQAGNPNFNISGYSRFWQRSSAAQARIAPSTIWFSHDYDNFHGKAGTIGARRYVYIDAHVSDYEN